MGSFRSIPAVEKVVQALGDLDLPRPLVVATVRRELAALRAGARKPASVPTFEAIVESARRRVAALRHQRIQTVINGTGVLIHTNLGRAPLGAAAVRSLDSIAANYTNLEYDLETGERGGRAGYLEAALALLCGAEAATVVNNGAAALVLALRHFTAGTRKEVVISRGELVQIGGGFRIPEILESSGATLREVGATNQTVLGDYARAVSARTALILKVHRSNFFMGGFVASPTTLELAALARSKRLPLIEDLGSGAVVRTERLAEVEHEPTPAEVLGWGVDLVCCSGDKLLGGPQAGIIAGRAKLVTALRREPWFRALRCDKLILAALQATVESYLNEPEGTGGGVPVLDLLQIPLGDLRTRGERIVAALAGLPAEVRLGQGKGQLGGGTLPRSVLNSVTVDMRPERLALAELAARLRMGCPPVIGYVSGGRLRLDLRTIFPHQDDQVITAIRGALA